jgi:DNA-directed RNA polymerase specialized sigma subunit
MLDLSILVMNYRESGEEAILGEVYKRTKKLVWGVVNSYKMARYPLVVLEDIVEDCRSLVLLKSIERYDPTRGAKFETFYTWWLRSHVQAKKGWYIRRNNVMLVPNMQGALQFVDEKGGELVTDKYNFKSFAHAQKGDSSIDKISEYVSSYWED